MPDTYRYPDRQRDRARAERCQRWRDKSVRKGSNPVQCGPTHHRTARRQTGAKKASFLMVPRRFPPPITRSSRGAHRASLDVLSLPRIGTRTQCVSAQPLRWRESNPLHEDYKSTALPDELHRYTYQKRTPVLRSAALAYMRSSAAMHRGSDHLLPAKVKSSQLGGRV